MAYVSSYLFSIDALMIDTGAHVMTTVECLWRPPSTTTTTTMMMMTMACLLTDMIPRRSGKHRDKSVFQRLFVHENLIWSIFFVKRKHTGACKKVPKLNWTENKHNKDTKSWKQITKYLVFVWNELESEKHMQDIYKCLTIFLCFQFPRPGKAWISTDGNFENL